MKTRNFLLLTLALLLFSSFVNAALSTNPTHAYNFDVLTDQEGSVDLINSGAARVSSLAGFGYDFEAGDSDYMTNDGNTSLLGTVTTGSMVFLIKPESTTSYGAECYKRTSLYAFSNLHKAIQLDGNVVQIYVYDNLDTSMPLCFDGSTTFNNGNYVGIFYTWNASGSRLYINGTLDTSFSGQTWAENSGITSDTEYIGSSAAGWYSDGIIDEHYYWDGYELTPSEITYIMDRWNAGDDYPFSTAAANFELTAANIYNSTALNNFSATITNATTTETIHTTNGSIFWGISETVNITIFNALGYFNKSYTNYDTSADLEAELTPYFYNHNDTYYSNFTLYNATNYVRLLDYAFNFTLRAGSNAKLKLYVDSVLEETINLTGYDTKHEYTGNYQHDTEVNASFWLSVESDDSAATFGNTSFYWDLTNPTIEALNMTNVNVFDTQANLTMLCTDSVNPILTYNMTFNSNNLFYGNLSNNTEQNNLSTFVNNANTLTGVCSDFVGSTTDTVTQSVYVAQLHLIDEIDNVAFDVSNISGARVYWADTSYYDFHEEDTNQINFSSLNNSQLRFALVYDSGETITRYIDLTLLEDTSEVKVCANKQGITHYEQEIISASVRASVLKSSFADCYIAADYTRFAYQDAYLLKAYTIETLYYLYTFSDGVQSLLASLDGSKSTYINLDTLEFKQTSYNINVLGDGLSFKKTGDTTVTIYYKNMANDTDAAKIKITDLSTDTVVLPETTVATPNEFTINFNYATLPVTNETLYQITVTKTINGEESTIKRYFNPQGKTGLLAAGLAAAISIILLFFGLTFTASRLAFSWFGIIIELLALAILSFAVSEWYIVLLQMVDIIILVYTFIILTQKTYPTVA